MILQVNCPDIADSVILYSNDNLVKIFFQVFITVFYV